MPTTRSAKSAPSASEALEQAIKGLLASASEYASATPASPNSIILCGCRVRFAGDELLAVERL